MISDRQSIDAQEVVTLSKYEGDALPENEFERVHIINGKIVSIDKIENGEVVSTERVGEV